MDRALTHRRVQFCGATSHSWPGRVRYWMRRAWREVVYAFMATIKTTLILTINVLAIYALLYLAFGR